MEGAVKPYDPLDYQNLAKSVVEALLSREPEPMPPKESFEGSGVYAIYYCGGFEPYRPISTPDARVPIYVGKAVPAGARKGQAGGRDAAGIALFARLVQHGRSIDAAENLSLADFVCRYLVVVPVWISLAERFLIEFYRPIWNVAIDGFGNHAPGSGRSSMKRPAWDILHPGRPWAARLEAEGSPEQILERLKRFFHTSGRG